MRYLKIAAAALLALASGSGQAQEAATPPGSQDRDIVVEGQRQALTATLKRMIDDGPRNQIARFEERLCPRVAGYPADWTAILERLIRANAKAAGLKMLKPGCKANAVVIFIADPLTVVKALEDGLPAMFSGLTIADKRRLFAAQRPVYSWRVVDQRGRDGVELDSAGTHGGVQTDARVVRNASATRLSENVREDILLSFVVIDIDRTPGKTLRQLADLATMHLLLNISVQATDNPDPSSILSLFAPRGEGEAAPETMSTVDRGALAGLYQATTNNYDSWSQRSRMARQIRRQEKAEAAAAEAQADTAQQQAPQPD